MLLGITFMLLGIFGGVAIFAHAISEERRRKVEIEKRKRKARLKRLKMEDKKAREKAREKAIEDDVKIYIPTRRIG